MMAGRRQTAPKILFKNISVDFEEKVLFRNLSFSVAAGKCTCLLGPSGCGKSTLLRLASGSRGIPYSGEVSFSSKNHGIGWMSQDDLLLPWMSLLDNVVLGAKLRGEESADTLMKASQLIHAAGLSKYEQALPESLSGGMRQRGALLRTLMEEGQVLLMDEPFSSLDALTRLKLQDLAVKLTKGRTVLLVTHDPVEALRMADEILVFSGEPASLITFGNLPGTTPRPPGVPELAKLHTQILENLLMETP